VLRGFNHQYAPLIRSGLLALVRVIPAVTEEPNVDPQMPPERFWRRCAPEFAEEVSLPLETESEGPKSGGNSRGIRRSRDRRKTLQYQ
jgi:hypothetical protein